MSIYMVYSTTNEKIYKLSEPFASIKEANLKQEYIQKHFAEESDTGEVDILKLDITIEQYKQFLKINKITYNIMSADIFKILKKDPDKIPNLIKPKVVLAFDLDDTFFDPLNKDTSDPFVTDEYLESLVKRLINIAEALGVEFILTLQTSKTEPDDIVDRAVKIWGKYLKVYKSSVIGHSVVHEYSISNNTLNLNQKRELISDTTETGYVASVINQPEKENASLFVPFYHPIVAISNYSWMSTVQICTLNQKSLALKELCATLKIPHQNVLLVDDLDCNISSVNELGMKALSAKTVSSHPTEDRSNTREESRAACLKLCEKIESRMTAMIKAAADSVKTHKIAFDIDYSMFSKDAQGRVIHNDISSSECIMQEPRMG